MLLLLAALQHSNIAVTPSSFRDAVEPQVVIPSSRLVLVAFGQGSDVFVSRSEDGAKSFESPVQVAHLDSLMLGMRRGPRIATDGKTIVVTAIGVRGGRSAELWAWRSVDRGEHWAGPVRVNDLEGAAQEGLQGLAAGGGKFVLAWLDNRSRGTKLFSSESADGMNWTSNRLVYKSPSGSICECCHPSVAVDSRGKATYMFRNSIDGNRDMYVVQDGVAKRHGNESWKLGQCPMDGGGLILMSDGMPYTIWRRGSDIVASYNGQTENPFGRGVQPVVAPGKRAPVCAFLRARNDALIATHPGDQLYQTVAPKADDPSIASGPGASPVVLVWTEPGAGIKARVLE